MFFKPIHILFITLTALLFSFGKSSANTPVYPVGSTSHMAPENISSSRHQVAQQIIVDSLMDSNEDNGDDETSSKSKHRLPKIMVTYPSKFNTVCVTVSSLGFNSHIRSLITTEKHSVPAFLAGKTSISIALCCLRI